MRLKIILLLLSITLFNQSFALVSVGISPGSGNCNYTTIQQALDSDATEINVLNSQNFEENLLIDHAVVIVGGFASCQDANSNLPPTETNTTIKGNDILGESVIRIETSNNPTIKLINLTLQSAVADDSVPNGGHGIKIDQSSGDIWIINSIIGLNNSVLGAGIFMKNTSGSLPTNLSVILENSSVSFNTATSDGGGVFCGGSGASLFVFEDSFIGANLAINGGGIYAENNCTVTMSSGVDVHNSSEFRGLMYNNASGDGGGIYAYSATIILDATLYGSPSLVLSKGSDTPITVAKNTAGNNGGGIFVINGAGISIKDALIEGNTAGNNGGGFYAESESQLEPSLLSLNKSNFSCWNEGACMEVSNNKAFSGGAFYLQGTAAFAVANASIKGNRANFGTVGIANGESSVVDISGSYLYNNGNNGEGNYNDNYVIRAFNNSTLSIVHSTLADNNIRDSSAIIDIFHAYLTVIDSIIHNAENVLKETDSLSVTASCLIVNENISISGPNIYVQDPGFIDTINQNYHIKSNSLAIDLCDSSLSGGYGYDSDGDPRAWDYPSVFNLEGSLDAGADEYFVDSIFKNGFE